MQTHREIQEATATENPLVVLQYRKDDGSDFDPWVTETVLIDYEEAETFVDAQRHRYPIEKQGHAWRFYAIPCAGRLALGVKVIRDAAEVAKGPWLLMMRPRANNPQLRFATSDEDRFGTERVSQAAHFEFERAAEITIQTLGNVIPVTEAGLRSHFNFTDYTAEGDTCRVEAVEQWESFTSTMAVVSYVNKFTTPQTS